MPNMYHPFDSRLEHRALGSAALTVTTTLATITEKAAQRTAYLTKVIIEAVKITANDELYQVVIEGSNDSFSSLEVLAMCDFGATEVRQSGAPDSVAGDTVEMYWTTEKGGTKYSSWRIRVITAGTSETITLGCYSTIMPGA